MIPRKQKSLADWRESKTSPGLCVVVSYEVNGEARTSILAYDGRLGAVDVAEHAAASQCVATGVLVENVRVVVHSKSDGVILGPFQAEIVVTASLAGIHNPE